MGTSSKNLSTIDGLERLLLPVNIKVFLGLHGIIAGLIAVTMENTCYDQLG
jgi:hypothetical protein